MEINMTILKELIKHYNLKLKLIEYIDGNPDWRADNRGYKLKLINGNKSFTFPFYQGCGITGDPKIEGVLDSLLSESNISTNLDDFCSELGYDITSLETKKLFKACQRIKIKMQNLLGNDFETFLYADRD